MRKKYDFRVFQCPFAFFLYFFYESNIKAVKMTLGFVSSLPTLVGKNTKSMYGTKKYDLKTRDANRILTIKHAVENNDTKERSLLDAILALESRLKLCEDYIAKVPSPLSNIDRSDKELKKETDQQKMEQKDKIEEETDEAGETKNEKPIVNDPSLSKIVLLEELRNKVSSRKLEIDSLAI